MFEIKLPNELIDFDFCESQELNMQSLIIFSERAFIWLVLIGVLLTGLPMTAPGHVPKVGGDRLVRIDNPSVSQVYCQILRNKSPHTYELAFSDSGTLVVGLYSPNPNPEPPTVRIEMPEGQTSLGGRTKAPVYEPFAPGVYYPVSRIQRSVSPGTNIIEVNGQGRYGLEVGNSEEFTVWEWIRIGLEIPRARLWSGRWWLHVPGLLAVIIFTVWFREENRPTGWLAGLSGALCVGTALSKLSALVWSSTVVSIGGDALIAIVQVGIQAGIGFLLIYQATNSSRTLWWRFWTATLSVLAALTWAGIILGPVLGLIASVIPEEK